MNNYIVLGEETVESESVKIRSIELINIYLPAANVSLGWVRTGGNLARMAIPYIYFKMPQTRSLDDLKTNDESVQLALKIYHSI